LIRATPEVLFFVLTATRKRLVLIAADNSAAANQSIAAAQRDGVVWSRMMSSWEGLRRVVESE
jgi:hypothetical protein